MDFIELRLKCPFTAIVAGPSSCGKTTLVKNIIERSSDILTTKPRKILYSYSIWQDAFENIPAEFIEGLPADDKLTSGTLLIVDDQMGECGKELSKLFTKKSHHMDISVIYIVQNIFSKEREMRDITLNAKYLFLFKNPRDKGQIIHLAKQMYPRSISYMMDAFHDATSTPFGYLLVDLTQDTDEKFRLRTGILPNETNYVYIKK
jgi:hypothetical protein